MRETKPSLGRHLLWQDLVTKFTAKQSRSNCVLYNMVTVHKNSYHLTKKLKECERSVWNPEQNECADNHMEKKIADGIRQRSYLNRLLSKCKTWNGQCTSVQELQRVLSIHGDIEQQIVRTELSYYKHTHPADVTARSHLFSLNTVTHEQRLDNLCCLLDDEGKTLATWSRWSICLQMKRRFRY